MRLLSIRDVVIMSTGVVFFILWLILFFKSAKHVKLFSGLNEKEYPLCQIYCTGYELMEVLGYKYKRKIDRSLRSDLSVLYEEKYVEYYLRLAYAQSTSLAILVFLFSFVLYGLSQEILILLIGFMLSGLCIYYYITLSRTKINKRSVELLDDFSEAASKLALLTNAGMVIREAWNEVAYAKEGMLYKEMQIACEEMENGISESESIRRFGVRCIIPEIKKLSSTIIQGMEKGNRELAIMLESQSNEIWEMKQQRIKRAGAKANTKLMIPMFVMFAGILIMIVVPIFTNLGV